ncbi:hypothetical protein SAMN03080606_03758 [Alkaliphilus peptidifermentans DSM 18978]|uniref:Uncharacterized protein n=1 Tax=Alkaliphilus peptidifermentans DSM 18978 TaxID=1120976 RepID=A0A1G5KUQ9_9FIRM|nr:hypothetical protein SAMN03080606_03758 [Alkaliphilus peptidifermentans DSM 18978]
MGINSRVCCCRCDELLGVGTEFEVQIGDNIRVFTTGGAAGPEPFMGELIAVEENTIVLNPVGQTNFVRYCCAQITSIEHDPSMNG